mmetsp:Transcript_17323/g.23356  ORF Transcript_17323/g.23356 Transcript_17323/m.23356 type:complete len:173 (-) Transcript_17323:324-842(-)
MTTLYTTGQVGNASTDLVMMVARAANVAITEVAGAAQEKALATRCMQEQGLQLTFPCLLTSEGDLVTESPAICHFIAATGAPQLLGASAQEMASVDQWCMFLRGKTLPLAKTLAGAVYGTVEMTPDEHAFISNELKENLKTINNQLKSKQFFCGGEQATIADYLFVLAVAEL